MTMQANKQVEFEKDKKFAAICAAAQSQAEATEAARALAPELARQLADAGMFAMFVPKDVGGHQLTPLEGNARLQVLAMHDAASAWVSMIGATAALGAAFFKPEISGPTFADPSRLICGIFASYGRARQDG